MTIRVNRFEISFRSGILHHTSMYVLQGVRDCSLLGVRDRCFGVRDKDFF